MNKKWTLRIEKICPLEKSGTFLQKRRLKTSLSRGFQVFLSSQVSSFSVFSLVLLSSSFCIENGGDSEKSNKMLSPITHRVGIFHQISEHVQIPISTDFCVAENAHTLPCFFILPFFGALCAPQGRALSKLAAVQFVAPQ